MKGFVNAQYKENNINGIIRKIAKITRSKNIYRDGYISIYSSSISSNSCLDVLTGTKEYTADSTCFQTQGDDSDPWITIDFHSLRLMIEGLSIYTGPGDYLPNYEVLVSNDNSTWEKVGSKSFDSKPPGWTYSFETTKKEARFIKLHGSGQRFDGQNLRMAIYELDLFGKLSVVSLIRQSCHVKRKSNIFNVILVEMITISK